MAPGAAVIAATGLAAAELWKLKTGRQGQRVRKADGRMAGAATRGARYLKINGQHPPPEDPEKLTGFYQLKDGRWMSMHCNFFNLRDINLKVARRAAGESGSRKAPSRNGMASNSKTRSSKPAAARASCAAKRSG